MSTEVGRFITHVADVNEVNLTHLNTIGSDLEQQDFAAAMLDLEQWDEWVNGELSWLKSNPPDPCYADMHAAWLENFTDYRKAAALLTNFLTNYNRDDFETSKELMDGTASRAGTRTQNSIKATAEACGAPA